jgi:hypothetical protein
MIRNPALTSSIRPPKSQPFPSTPSHIPLRARSSLPESILRKRRAFIAPGADRRGGAIVIVPDVPQLSANRSEISESVIKHLLEDVSTSIATLASFLSSADSIAKSPVLVLVDDRERTWKRVGRRELFRAINVCTQFTTF